MRYLKEVKTGNTVVVQNNIFILYLFKIFDFFLIAFIIASDVILDTSDPIEEQYLEKHRQLAKYIKPLKEKIDWLERTIPGSCKC